MSELDLLLKDFEETADHMHQLVADLRNIFTTKEETVEPEEKENSFTQLRALCASKSQDGFTKNVRELILATGAKKLSEVEPNRYQELYKKVEALK